MIKNISMNEFPILDEKEGIPLFFPYIPDEALANVTDTLSGRWIGQGPKVDKFEELIKKKFLGACEPLAVGSGTDALHLSYILAGIKNGDKVMVPTFTCTATNIPLLYIGAELIFIDIDPDTMNVSVQDIRSKISPEIKAIVTVDYGGVCCDYEEIKKIADDFSIPIIQDAAHSIGSKYNHKWVGSFNDFTIFSFQAIKTLTTGDGGLLSIQASEKIELAKRLRWFGIDRLKKQGGIWENDIIDVGYKYQMTDIAASIGIAGINNIDKIIEYRKSLFEEYKINLINFDGIKLINSNDVSTDDFCPWLITIIVEKNRIGLMKKLREYGIESAQVHYRNDRYSIFGNRRSDLPNMDIIEDKYLVLPIHNRIDKSIVNKICNIIKSGW